MMVRLLIAVLTATLVAAAPSPRPTAVPTMVPVPLPTITHVPTLKPTMFPTMVTATSGNASIAEALALMIVMAFIGLALGVGNVKQDYDRMKKKLKKVSQRCFHFLICIFLIVLFFHFI
jgi:hypothetical protein